MSHSINEDIRWMGRAFSLDEPGYDFLPKISSSSRLCHCSVFRSPSRHQWKTWWRQRRWLARQHPVVWGSVCVSYAQHTFYLRPAETIDFILFQILSETHGTKQKRTVASIFSLGVVFLFLSYAYSEQIIKPRLYDGSINELGRYSFTFDAYDYIEENSENPIIALGSSKMREIFDGQPHRGVYSIQGEFFNLAYARRKAVCSDD